MITSNPEHKKAVIKKIIQVGKTTLLVSLAGLIATTTIFIHTITKQNEIGIAPEYGGYIGSYVSTVEILKGHLEEEFGDSLTEGYEKKLKEKEKVVISAYDEKKSDEDVIEFSDDWNKSAILDSLLREDIITSEEYEEYKNKPYIKVGDLKKITDLSFPESIHIYSGSDISWLNYCTNLKYLLIEVFDEVALENLNEIEGLNITSLEIIPHRRFEGKGCNIDEKNFSFLQNCHNLHTIELDSSVFSINSEFLQKIAKTQAENKSGLALSLINFGVKTQKFDISILNSFSKVIFYCDKGTGKYDMPLIFSREDFNKLFTSDLDITIVDEDSKRIEIESYVKEVNEVYDQIDNIVSNLNIDENMSDKDKLKVVLDYVLKELAYNEESSKIQEEQGYEADVFGAQSEDLVEETKKSYTDGFLYGVLNENGKPICGNYAALMQVLLNRCGVEVYVVGSDYHAYNLVNVEDEYYYVDPTFLDQETIDLDEIIEDGSIFIPVGVLNKTYDTNITPAEVDLPEFDIEKRVDQVINQTKKPYIIKFKNQLYNVSFTALMSILSGLGLAVSKKKLNKIEREQLLNGFTDEDEKLKYLISEFEVAKEDYKYSNLLEKAYLRLTGQSNFKKKQEEIDEVQEEIDELKGMKK